MIVNINELQCMLGRASTLLCLVPRRFGLFTSLSARGTAREGEKRKIRREAPGRIRTQNGGSVFCKCSVLFILLLK